MKLCTAIGVTIFALNFVLISPQILAQETALRNETNSIKKIRMPAIRKIGLGITTTNISEFLTFMKDESSNLKGFVALPMSVKQAEEKLTNIFAKKINDSGRFWTLSVDTVNTLQSNLRENEKQQFIADLQQKYELDAWIETSVKFSPDNTLIKATVKGTPNAKFILAREDILIGPEPSVVELENAFSKLISRVINTFGHDGKITFERSNLVVIDFGSERGLIAHEKLHAGVVLLTATHPQTGEFLRFEQIEALELEVVEARRGSSLCKIITEDKIALNIIDNISAENKGKSGLLVWRSTPNPGTSRGPKEISANALIGGTEKGFEDNNGYNFKQEVEAKVQEPTPVSTPKTEVKKTDEVAKPKVELPMPTPKPEIKVEQKTEIKAESKPEIKAETVNEPVAVSSNIFSKIVLQDINLGLGFAYGTVIGENASASSSFPISLLNAIKTSTTAKIMDNITAEIKLGFAYYRGEDFSATKTKLATPFFYNVFSSSEVFGELNMALGAGPMLGVGDAQATVATASKITTLNQSFNGFDIALETNISTKFSESSSLKINIALSAMELALNQNIEADLSIELIALRIANMPLGLYVQSSVGPGIWNNSEIGLLLRF